jgi:YfiH family protein
VTEGLFLDASGPWDGRARIGTTTRRGGVSRGPYAALNLGDGAGDDPAAVRENRRILVRTLGLDREPCWLRQVHGTRIVRARARALPEREEADGAWTDEPGVALAVLTADCAPVVFHVPSRGRLAVAHAGWKGFARGVLEAALDALGGAEADSQAWIGPAVDPAVYEVGPEVRDACLERCPEGTDLFRPTAGDRFACDLPGLIARRLTRLGVGRVIASRYSTAEAHLFYSYRREARTGRQATLAWLLDPG